jgi:hypothetical protein
MKPISRVSNRLASAVYVCAWLAASGMLTVLFTATAAAEMSASGAIVGVVTSTTKVPMAHVTVTATKVGGGGFRAVLTGGDGSYSFWDLAPGKWSVTSHAEGAPDAAAQIMEVDATKAARCDVVVALAPGAAPPQQPPTIPVALQAPDPGPEVDNDTPFAYGDFTWLNGTPRTHQPIFDTKFFTPEIRFDSYLVNDFNHPADHTISGSTEEFRSGEVQIEQVSFGGDFHYDNVKARFLSMFGLFSVTTPRNDASSGAIGGVGQWNTQDAYRYLSEASAGYHWDVDHGLNVDVGIFVSYIGLFSYYNFDNWTYQPSYVSSNTPWFFNGIRVQYYPTNKLKIEPWLINGWQSYVRFNKNPGFGGQILWMPNEDLKFVFNNYTMGNDNLQNYPPGEIINGVPVNFAKTQRIHTDDSVLVKYYQNNTNGEGLSKAAFSLTLDAGCQHGGGITCTNGVNKSAFLGWMAYDRYWFDHDLYAITVGGGSMTNPGRYLTLLPPINGATASTGTPYFTENPGQTARQWDMTLNLQYMPKEWITWWTEVGYRHSSIPYFNGSGGITPPFGNNGSPASYACMSGASSGFGAGSLSSAQSACSTQGGVWFPDLWTHQATLGAGVMVKF